jgi:threonine dehydrogenase-like Zn-dependent dehydrogenase
LVNWVCFHGAAADVFVVDAGRLVEVDSQLPATSLVLTEPLAIAVHAVRRLTASGTAEQPATTWSSSGRARSG